MGGSEVHEARACEGGRRMGEKISKIFKKSMKTLQFLIILIENLYVFPQNFFKFLRNFSRKFGQKFRKSQKYAFPGVRRRGRPEDSECIKILVENQ